MKLLAKVKGTQWGRSYQWRVLFGSFEGRGRPPSAYSDWVPVSNVSHNLGVVLSQMMELGNSGYQFPKGSSVKVGSIEFYDDDQGTLQKWFEDWINSQILPGGLVAPLCSTLRRLRVCRLRGDNQTFVLPKTLLVYPDGDITFTGNSDSGAVMFTVNFIIAGIE